MQQFGYIEKKKHADAMQVKGMYLFCLKYRQQKAKQVKFGTFATRV